MTSEHEIGIGEIDTMHDDLFQQIDTLKKLDGRAFVDGFKALITHTESHFAMEEELMRSYRFYALQEHLDEHRHLLNEMRYFYNKAERMPHFGRAYIDDYAFDKFKRHIVNLDSQLAMFLKTEWKAMGAEDA